MNTELRTLIKREQQNPDLQSTLDIEALLNQPVAQRPINATPMTDQSLAELAMDKYQSMSEAGIPTHKIVDFCGRLGEYQYVDKVCQLQRGKYIRWIRLADNDGEPVQDHDLNNGAVVISVKFLEKGTNILVKVYKVGRYIQIRFNECLVYMRMTEDELLAIGCAEILAKDGL